MLSWNDLFTWQADWLTIHPDAIEKRRVFLHRALSDEQAHFMRAVQTLRYGRERLVRGYADVFYDQLELDSSVATTSNLDRLLVLAQRPGRDDKPDPRRWFEAVSRFDQAVAVSKIEMDVSLESLDRDMNDLLDFLFEHLFVGGFEKLNVYCYHDPQAHYMVRAEDVGIGHQLSRHGLVRRKSDLTCRRTNFDTLTYIRHRVKDPFDAWLKMHRQRFNDQVADPTVVHDRCGITFVVPTLSEVEHVAIELATLLLDDGAVEIEALDTNYGRDRRMDPRNQLSSASYKVAKMSMNWRGREFEFQFITLHDYFTSKRSLTDSNHELYRLRQTLDHFFPLLWPNEIYHVDWTNPRTRHMLREWKESQLGWRLNGKFAHK